MSILSSRPATAVRSLALVGLAALMGACNGLLGIEEPTYDPALDPPTVAAAAGAGGGTGAGGAGEPRLEGDPTCASYCSQVMANCTDSLQPYPAMETCQAMCEQLDNGPANDLSKNTVECRLNHAALAATDLPNKTLHCLAAGPLGDGVCGDPCAAFCALAQGWCAPPQITTAIYPDPVECATACAKLPRVQREESSFFAVDDANNLNCRDYHLQAAYKSPASAITHCSHTAIISATCN